MPSIPRHSQPLDSDNLLRPRSISSFESDTSSHIHTRDTSSDFLTSDGSYSLSPRSLDFSLDSASQPLDSHAQPLIRRQTFISNLPATYAGINDGPSAGTVVGIVLGVVLGYLLIFWLIVAVISSRARATYIEGDDTNIVVRRNDGHHSSRRSKRSHRSRRARTEASEVSEQPRPRRQPSPRQPSPRRTERVVYQETTRRSVSRPPPQSPRSDQQENISININDRRQSRMSNRVPGDDEVDVVEESGSASTPDPQPRRKSRHSGVRHVDPNQYAGGNYPRHEFSRSRSRR